MTGQTFGHYRILEKIGAGGMGEVYRARDDFLKRDIAIKTLHPGLLGDAATKEKLLREARSSSALSGPHICTIYEVGESGGRAFIAMELVEGRPLKSLIPAEGLPSKLAVRYGSQIAAALAHAHDHGIVHRDVKTSNVMITPSGAVLPATRTLSRRRIAWLAGLVSALCLAGLLALDLGGLRSRMFGPRPSSQIQSLAVLPLENLSSDPDQEYFADGMTDALITELAKAGSFRVISRTSVMPYKSAKKPLPRIAQELGVDAVVAGTVLESGNRVRITAQLIDARTDKHLWAENYQRDVRDILSMQDDVANAIATAIHGRITAAHSPQLQRPQVNPEAYRLYLKGMYFWDKHTEEGFQKAITFLQEAIGKDPSFASAYAALADCYLAQGGFSLSPTSDVLPKARAAASRALEVDASLSDARQALASVHMAEWNFTEAEKEFRRALELNPNDAGAHQGYGGLLTNMGRFDEALIEVRKAVELDPLYITHGIVLGNVFYYRGDYDAALKEYNKVLDMDPNYWLAHGSLALTYGQKKMYPEAFAELQKVLVSFPHSNATAVLGQLKALSGEKNEARKIARELRQHSKKEYVSDYWVATIYAALGDNNDAFRLLENAYTERSQWLVQLKVDPRFANLRSDPRFQDLLRRIGLPA